MAEQPPRKNPLPELKTPVAWGKDSKRIYAKNIKAENVAIIKSKLPRDVDGARVEPNIGNASIRPHFFVVGSPVPGKALRRNEISETHANTQEKLLEHLRKAKSKIDFFTYGPPNQKLWRNEIKVLSLLEGSKYQWVEDPETRIWMNNQEYLQPDIAGRDIKRFAASPNYPWVILEVVHSHWPNERTWHALVELSKRNHFIAFYCVTEEHYIWQMNSLRTKGSDRLSIRVQIYLKEGQLYDGVSPVALHGDTSEEIYQSAFGYLVGAQKAYLAEQEKKEIQAEEARQAAERRKTQE